MYTSQFSEFRRQHPTACLSTDLLTIHESLYVVRAQVHVEEKLLATGMAADATLETAEDRACTRVLQRLGLGSPAPAETIPSGVSSPPPNVLPLPSVSSPAAASATPDFQPSGQPEQQESLFPTPEEEFISLDWEEEPELMPLGAPSAVPASGHRDAGQQPQPVAVSGGGNSLTEVRSDAIAPVPLSQPSTKPSPLASISAPPVDLSDIIAQTDVELRRLGWNVAQGREFLEKTYGKRSRHDLTDQELLAFLLYLEMQPSP